MSSWIVGYLSQDMTRITDWHGVELGLARVKSSWRMPHGVLSDRQYQIEATIDGARYTGRSLGANMLWRGKRMKQ